MKANQFWDIIENYNRGTWIIQLVFIFIIILCAVILYKSKIQSLLKIALGITNLFIGVVFFIVFGKEPIQTFFAAPLFIASGLLFLLEGIRYRDDTFIKLSKTQLVLLFLVILYPIFSLLLGNTFPRMVLYIMPCPAVSLSIVIYSCYEHKNKLLLALLTIWGLTGIKSFFFNVYEDAILLICGVFCIYTLIREFKYSNSIAHR